MRVIRSPSVMMVDGDWRESRHLSIVISCARAASFSATTSYRGFPWFTIWIPAQAKILSCRPWPSKLEACKLASLVKASKASGELICLSGTATRAESDSR